MLPVAQEEAFDFATHDACLHTKALASLRGWFCCVLPQSFMKRLRIPVPDFRVQAQAIDSCEHLVIWLASSVARTTLLMMGSRISLALLQCILPHTDLLALRASTLASQCGLRLYGLPLWHLKV